MKKTKILLLFVSLVVMGFMLSIHASADTYTWKCGDSVKASYNTNTGHLYITGNGPMYDDWVPIPYAGMKSVSVGYGVTSIGQRTFSDLHITNVSLPSTLVSIGNSAFSYCSNLKSVTIPDSVTSLGTSVFRNCSSLTNVTLGTGITKIPNGTFLSCYALTSITIPNSVEEIGTDAFVLAGLTSIDIPDSVTIIGDSAFSACRSLETVNMSSKVKSIGDTAFHDTLIRSIELPNTLTTIGKKAFNSCDYLSHITLPDSLISILEDAFNGCVALSEITIPKNVTSVGDNAFKGCTALETVNYNAVNCSSMGDMSNSVFSGCTALKNVNIASNVKIIPSYAFYGCSTVEKLVFPNSIISMGANIIGGCSNLKELSIPFVGSKRGNTGTADACLGHIFDYTGTLYSSGSNGYVSQSYRGYGLNPYVTFYMPSTLTKIIITDETVIGVGALSDLKSVTEVVLPDTLLRIEKDAFMDGEVLAKINLPINLKYLGEDAFTRCYALSNVIYNAKNCTEFYDAFTWSGNNAVLTIGEVVETLPKFKGLNTCIINFYARSCNSEHICFSEKTEYINIGDEVTRLPENIFAYCKLVTSINIPESVTYIDDMAFQCMGLTEISIPDSVKSVGSLIFAGCDNLKTVNIGSGLESMEFLMCSDRSNVERYIVSPLNNYFSSVDGNLYNKAKNTLIHYATGKTDEFFIVPSTVEYLGNYSLRCSKLKRISLTESIIDIGEYTFAGCTNLESINIPDTVTTIGEGAFSGCSSLKDVYYSGIQEEWGSIAIGRFNDYLINASIHYLGEPDADYMAVEKAIAKVEAIDRRLYTETSLKLVDDAVNAVVYGLTADKQAAVDAYAQAIEDAVSKLELKNISKPVEITGDLIDYNLRCTTKVVDGNLVLTANPAGTSSMKIRFGNLPEGAELMFTQSNANVSIANGIITVKNPGLGRVEVPMMIISAEGLVTDFVLVGDFGNAIRYATNARISQNGNDVTVTSGNASAYLLFDTTDIDGGYIVISNESRNLLGRAVKVGTSAVRFYNPSYDEGTATVNVKNADGEIVESYNVTMKFSSATEYTPILESSLRCSYTVDGDTIYVTADAGATNVYLILGKYYSESLSASVNDATVKKTGARSWRVMKSNTPIEFDVYFDATQYGADVVTRHIVVNF